MSDRRREFTDQRYVLFATCSAYRKRRLLNLDHPKRIVLGVLNHQLAALSAASAERGPGRSVAVEASRGGNTVAVELMLPQD